MSEEFLTLQEAAQRMNVTAQRVSQMIRSGQLKAEVFPHSNPRYLISLDVLTDLMTKRAASNRTKPSYERGNKKYKAPITVTNREAKIARMSDDLFTASKVLKAISKNPDLIDLILDTLEES